MSEAERLYSKDHMWLKLKNDTAVLGMTDFAQQELGDIIMVVLPEVGTLLTKGQVLCALDSMDYFYEFHIPVSGEVTAVNERIDDEPELINEHPLDEGWLAEIALFDIKQMEPLMNLQQYEEYICEHPVLKGKVEICR